MGPAHAELRNVDRVVLQAWAGVHGYAALLVSQQPAQPNSLIERGASRRAIAAYAAALTRGLLGPRD